MRGKKKLLGRVRRIRGQVEAIERALDAELGCWDVLQLVASVRGAVNGLSAELLEDHIRSHMLGPQAASELANSGEELIELVRTYMK